MTTPAPVTAPKTAPETPAETASTAADTPASLLVFPTDFPIKIMGKRVDHFAREIAAVVREHAPDFDVATLELRASSGGNYLSVTATVRATSREQLDALYRALTSHPLVKVVL
jgi:putative lipoic acid-binding regulatory protein